MDPPPLNPGLFHPRLAAARGRVLRWSTSSGPHRGDSMLRTAYRDAARGLCVWVAATLAAFSCSGVVLAATAPSLSDLPLERRREIMHVSPLEAAHKAATLARVSSRAQAATANQQAYDVHYYNLDVDVD